LRLIADDWLLQDGFTPLLTAADNGHHKAAQALLDAGAAVDSVCKVTLSYRCWSLN
jgi:ankyrin repeat protein